MNLVLISHSWCDNLSCHGWAGAIAPRPDQFVEGSCVYLPDNRNEAHNILAVHLKLTARIDPRNAQWLEGTGTPEEHPVGRRGFSQQVE